MYQDDIKEENGQYVIKDETSGGYVDRMNYSFMYRWITVWDKELNLVSMKLGFEDLTETLEKKDKEHVDYHRGVRARNRHLKILKNYLGIDYKKQKSAEKKTEKIILLQKGLYSKFDQITINEATIYDKTVGYRGSSAKKHELYFTPFTPEKESLMKEYNEKLKEFVEFRRKMFKEIFDEE